MPVRTISCVFGPYDKRAFSVNSEPWWACVLLRVVDTLCCLTLHRWCDSRLMHWAVCLSDRHTDSFTIPTDDATLVAYGRWRKFDGHNLDGGDGDDRDGREG